MVENICYFRSSGERREEGRVKEKKRKEKKIYAVENSRVIFFERAREKEVEGGFKRYSPRFFSLSLRKLSRLGSPFFRLFLVGLLPSRLLCSSRRVPTEISNSQK